MAVRAQGSVFKVATVTVAKLTNITTNISLDELDITNHDSTAAWREFLGGLKDMTIDIEGNYLPADDTQDGTAANGLINLLETATAVTAMSIEWSDAATTTFTFNGWVTSFNISAPVDDVLSFTASIRVSGQPTLA